MKPLLPNDHPAKVKMQSHAELARFQEEAEQSYQASVSFQLKPTYFS